MRFSTTALLALPLLAAAAESPFEQYKAKFQNFLSNFGASTPGADKADGPAVAGEAPSVATGAKGKNAVEPKTIESFTLEDWKGTLYGPVRADAAQPQPAEWLVLVTGRNKTCLGRCERIETAFAEAAVKFASLPSSEPSPQRLARVNCEDQPVLCNSWSANAGSLWLFEVPAAPDAIVEIYTKRMNLTTVTPQDVVDVYAGAVTDRAEAGWNRTDPTGWFHPIEGKLAKFGLSVPLGYAFWALGAIPSWGMMLIMSFVSRTMMNRGMNRGAGAPGAPRAAPAGDAR
ncbi:hypothetical protein N658DRAFT_499663 [Parathielavia hyrcaniae]|uniref:Peptidyl-tRNA hydrolase n=1 Tax=Parathielavia hyrcaniae TaxID=113614 RepID=A0AAN6PUL3_9PEZI|nr:hypothetical protein N658DRAFT_499663 [Parathielavia hyrcaniae]